MRSRFEAVLGARSGSADRRLRRSGRAWAALLLAAAVAAVLVGPGPARAGSFMISPTKFEFPLERRYTNFFTVTNTSTEPASIRVYAQSVGLNDANQVVERPGAPGDMTHWVVINPRRLTLGPQEKRVVRFSVRSPGTIPPGEYNTFLFFEELPAPPDEGAGKTQTPGARLDLLTRVGAALWGQVGPIERKVALEPGTAAWKNDHLDFTGSLANQGNAHATVTVQATLLDGFGKAEREWQGTVVLFRGDVRHLQLDWKRPAPGSYTLRVAVSGDGVPPAETETALVVPKAEGG